MVVSPKRAGGGPPAEVTSFVGRQRELDSVHEALTTSRLVTLTGAGGVGKSRLALRVAQRHRRVFADAVRLVELADLREPSLLASTVADALGLTDSPGREPLRTRAARHLDGRAWLRRTSELVAVRTP